MLYDLCRFFPADPDRWTPNLHPADALGLSFRARIRRGYGALESASDRARPRSPSRLGISLQRYEPGDPIRTLALRHFVTTGELLTRTDAAPGRQSALIVLHGYENMRFRSLDVAGNKWQVALAAAAVVEAIQNALDRHCSLRLTHSHDLPATLAAMRREFSFHQSVHVLTDLLFAPGNIEASGTTLLRSLVDAGARHPNVIVVRDPLELPHDSRMAEKTKTLQPFVPLAGISQLPPHFSGEDYAHNLTAQLDAFSRACRESRVRLQVLSGRTAIVTVAQQAAMAAGSTAR